MNNDLKIILSRIDKNFLKKKDVKYSLQVVNDCYDSTYNFFINIQPLGKRLHSIPLHTIENYDLSDLEKLLIKLWKNIALQSRMMVLWG
ncbi:acetyl-CoA carboxylase [Companilactobacillus sp. FL22-1]|uniref:acetyl-CoA carboxylase n=1 Tax=Companilactobacillus sp. FL22-1 TaxID=3373892 RepID=UPI0037544C3A